MIEKKTDSRHLKICMSPGTLSTGGIGRNTLNLSAYYVEQGHSVDIIIMGLELGSRQSEVPENVKLINISKRSRYALLNAIRYLNSAKPDLIISAHDNVNFIMILAKKLSKIKNTSKLICTFRTHRSTQLKNSSIRGKLYDWLARKVYPFADELVAVSKGVADDWNNSNLIPQKEMKVIYNPAWTSEIEKKSNIKCTHRWLVKKDLPVVVTAGRLTRQKNLEMLIEAFSVALRDRMLRLIIIGDGEDRRKLEAMVSNLDLGSNVDFMGYLANPYAEMRMADLFVLASAWEGFGNVVVEALGCGLSVVSTDCPSGPGEILDSGKYGTLVKIGDVHGLASAMLEMIDNPRNAYIQKSRAYNFSVENAGKEYLRLVDR